MEDSTSKPCMRRISSRRTMMLARLLTWKIRLGPLLAVSVSCISPPMALLHRVCFDYSRMRQPNQRDQHIFLAMDQGGRVQRSQFEAMSMSDGIRWTGLHAVAAKDAAVVVNVIDLGIAVGAGDSLLRGILGRLDVDAVGRAGRRAQEAGNTFLQAILIPLQHMRAAKAIGKESTAVGTRSIRVVFHFGGVQHLAKGDAHSLGHAGYVAHNGHKTSIRRR